MTRMCNQVTISVFFSDESDDDSDMEGSKVNHSDLEETDNDSQHQLSKSKKKKAALISSSSDGGDDSSEENVKVKAAAEKKSSSKPGSKKSNKLGFTTESNDSDGKNINTLMLSAGIVLADLLAKE